MAARFLALLPGLTANERAGYAEAVAGAGERARVAEATVGFREGRAEAVAAVRGWTPEQRRAAALRLHADAVAAGSPSYYQRDPIAVLAAHGLPGSRADLVWSLHLLADERGLDDGRVYRLPATIAAALTLVELDGLAPALLDLLDEVNGVRMAAIRRDLLRLLGTGIEIATGCHVPPHLLHDGDQFGPKARQVAGPDTREVLLHAASLAKPAPSAAWRAAAQALSPDTAWAILDLFTAHDAYVHPDTDLLLRGLLWMLAGDTSEEMTALVGRVAVAAATVHGQGVSLHAPKTAAAAVDILATRPGDRAGQVLRTMSVSTRNKPLLSRIRTALAIHEG